MTRKITMEYLAREAGCSKSQVSRALNGRENVAPEIRARVRELAARLHYRNLARNHTPNIALVLPMKLDHYNMSLAEACLEEATRRNWGCMIIDSRQCARLNEYHFDGAISALFDQAWPRHWGELRNLPLVTLNSYGFRPDHILSIDPDPFAEAMLVLEHLKSLGHRRIARIHVEAPEHAYHRGSAEFLEAARQLELLPDTENIDTPGPLTPEFFTALLTRGFRAFYVIHQYLAIPATRALALTGWRVPEEVSLVTYELPRLSENLTPPHTTLDFDYAGMAERAFQQLALRFKGEAPPDNAPKVPVLLNVRGTTGPFNPSSRSPDCN